MAGGGQTLFQYYRGSYRNHRGEPSDTGLPQAFLADRNVEMIEGGVYHKVKSSIGDLAGPKELMTVEHNVLLRDMVLQVARERGHQMLSPRNLGDMNNEVVNRAAQAISPDLLYQARFERFRKHGVRPTDIPRPEFDHDALDNQELSRAPHGVGRSNPYKAMFGGAVQTFGQFASLVGPDPRNGGRSTLVQRTGSDAIRINAFPQFPVYRQAEAGTPVGNRAPYSGLTGPTVQQRRQNASQLNNHMTTMGYGGTL